MSAVYCSLGDGANPAKPLRLLDRMRQVLRAKHYAYSAEQAYVHWARRYILFHSKRHPKALCTLMFLYKYVLKIELPSLDAVRAKRPKRIPAPKSAAAGYNLRKLLRWVVFSLFLGFFEWLQNVTQPRTAKIRRCASHESY